MTKAEKTAFRSRLFRHLDGLVSIPTAYCLYDRGVLPYLLAQKNASVQEVAEHFSANAGYLNVALRVLAAQGWLDYQIEGEDIRLSINDDSAYAFDLMPIYQSAVELIQYSGRFHPRKFDRKPFGKLLELVRQYQNRFDLPRPENADEERIQEQMLAHVEGIIVGPTVVALGMNGMFHKYFMEASFKPEEFHADAESFEQLLDVFASLGWFNKLEGTYTFTDKGLFFARRASAYGVTVSYLPTFRAVDELIFGNPLALQQTEKGADELHVDREMNVWGSGGAHGSYFKKIDQVIIDLFNRPIEQQPKGIVDMGCGNGAFLIHLYEVIEQRTLRGSMLEDYPLFLVGADYNQAALSSTRANLVQAEIWAKLIWGDIGRPDLLDEDLRKKYRIELGDLLNVRTFLDHNRIWFEPTQPDPERVSTSTGAFASKGRLLPNALVEDNLKEHFEKWAPYLQRFGLLMIELHTIDAGLTAKNLGRTAATAYDATHGFSDQYIVEIDVFHRMAQEAGLQPVMNHFFRFPDSELATVSVNLLKGK